MSDLTLTGTGSGVPAGSRAAAATPTGPTPADQTPGRAEVHVHDAPPPPARRPMAAGAGRRLHLAAGGPTPRRPGRRRPSRHPPGGHHRAPDQHTRPAPPGAATTPRPDATPPDLTAILNANLTAILNGNLTAAGGTRGRVRARPAGQALRAGRGRPRCLRLLRAGLAGLAAHWLRLGADDRRRAVAMAPQPRPRPARQAAPSRGPVVLRPRCHRRRLDPSRRHGRRRGPHGRGTPTRHPVRIRLLRWSGLFAAARPPA
jgi:hypothetical protein